MENYKNHILRVNSELVNFITKPLWKFNTHKEKVIKEVIDSYEGIIPEPHYSRLKIAIYNYEVEMDD